MSATVFGKSFLEMVTRFAAFGVVLSATGIAVVSLFADAKTVEVHSGTILFSVICNGLLFSIMGWGLAFWRFEATQRPIRSFALVPAVLGFFLFHLMLHASQLPKELSRNEYLGAALFVTLFGPPMAVIIAAFFRTAPTLAGLERP